MFSIPVLAQATLNGLNLSAIYIMVALGFTLIFGIMRIINFAHGEFAMVGGYTLLWLFGELQVPFLLALPLAAVLVATVGLGLEATVYRRFYGREIQGMIATLGLSIALTYGVVILFDTHERVIPPAFDAMYFLGPVILTADRIMVFVVTALTLGAFFVLMRFTRIGLAMRVVAQDVDVAEAQGINARATFRAAFFIATMLAALAGGLLGQLYSLSPFMGAAPLIKAFIVVIIGGLGSITGAAVGGLLLGIGESFTSTFIGASAAQFLSFAAVILILLVRPAGLFGREA